MESKRLFLAIQPPAEVCALIASAVREAMQTAERHDNRPGAEAFGDRSPRALMPIRLVAEHNLHLTLQFLGETPVETIARIERALTPRLARCWSFGLEVTRFGCFPSPRRPRVVWAGLHDPSIKQAGVRKDGAGHREAPGRRRAEPTRPDPLLRVYTEVCSGLAECGINCESRPFQAHITVGYVRREAVHPAVAVQRFLQCADAVLAEAPASPICFDAVSVALVESRLTPQGAQYRNLVLFPLHRDENPASTGTRR